MDNLTDNEIIQLRNGDISFLSEVKMKREKWIATYNKNKEERDKKVKKINNELKNNTFGKLFGESAADVVTSIAFTKPNLSFPGGDSFPYREEFGMEPCPTAPDYEYLKCWKEVWGKKDENVWSKLKNKKCANYYPLSKKETKTLKVCDEERKEKEANRRNIKNLVYSFLLGVITTLIGVYLSYHLTNSASIAENHAIKILPNNLSSENNIIKESPIVEKQNKDSSDEKKLSPLVQQDEDNEISSKSTQLPK